MDPNGVDFPYFDALLADLSSKYCVDAGRVLAAGKSNGAFMVNALACFRPGMLRGLASVAGGGPQTSRCPGTFPGLAVMLVHGSADRTVPIRSGQWTREYWLYRNGTPAPQPNRPRPRPCVGYPGRHGRCCGASTMAATVGRPGPVRPWSTSSSTSESNEPKREHCS